MSDRYALVLARPARRALTDGLPLKIASAVRALVDGDLGTKPRAVGKPLNAPFTGQRVARRSSYRVRYRIEEAARRVTVLDIRGRADAYHCSGGR
ncbi:type II toxin-antitoxin system RelE/ParE family toxin [Nocardiopsis sp. NPDC006198]|uniref:type II toxin-antitoxin system RelE/ParE family toxin n=1 Tax=Nocardiopsis sp. NPDC006198 TaxID=3154472 RepID=UPI0033A7C80C